MKKIRKKIVAMMLVFSIFAAVLSDVSVYAEENFLHEDVQMNSEVESVSVSSSLSLSEDLSVEIGFLYDDVNWEKQLVNDKKFTAVLELTNLANVNKNVVCYISSYDEEGNIIIDDLVKENITVGKINTKTSKVNTYFSPKTETAKIFVWDADNNAPIIEPVVLTKNAEDSYSETKATSTKLSGNYSIRGKMNTSSDVDFIKLIMPQYKEYTFDIISANGVNVMVDDTVMVNKRFVRAIGSKNELYLKISSTGGVGDYYISIKSDFPSESANFDVYNFDADLAIYKKSILNLCEKINNYFPEYSEEMYLAYEKLLETDEKLHRLPDFLENCPKDLENYDDLVNRYCSTKYPEFINLKKEYLALIDKYDELVSKELEDSEITIFSAENEVTEHPIFKNFTAKEFTGNGEASAQQERAGNITYRQEPSFTIVETTPDSITYDVVFPFDAKWGNAIHIYKFDSGETVWENVHGEDVTRWNGRYTISNLTPGTAYVLQMSWTEDNFNYGGENSICRFVQLPYEENNKEVLKLYKNPDETARVSACMEEADLENVDADDFNNWLNNMNKAYNSYKELTGYTPFDSKVIVMKSTRENLNEKFGVENGNNYWWVYYGYYDRTNVFKFGRTYYRGLMRRLSQGDWGQTPLHELSHVFDNERWIFDEETLAELKLYYIMETLNAKIYEVAENENTEWYEGYEYYNYLKTNRFIQSYVNSFEKGEYSSEGFAALLIDIQKQIGWQPFKRTFRFFQKLDELQVPANYGEKLNIFLNKLSDYSNQNVLELISDRDIGIIEEHYNITLDYFVSYIKMSSGRTVSIELEPGESEIFNFKPIEDASYDIYTTKYAESGVVTDTYVEVYEYDSEDESSLGRLVAENDDVVDGKFSKITLNATAGKTYRIKVRHAGECKVHAEININHYVQPQELTMNVKQDIIVIDDEFKVFEFQPSEWGTYVFEAVNTESKETYMKLYDDINRTNRLAHNENKIIANLYAGRKYYLQFSGYSMHATSGTLTVKPGATLEFKKSTDSNFIYVNNPEYITRLDIVDDERAVSSGCIKLFEQQGITGKNTFYEPHLVWWGTDDAIIKGDYYPVSDFYFDIDFYNECDDCEVKIVVPNLTYMNDKTQHTYEDAAKYLNDNFVNKSFTLGPGEHKLLFKDILGEAYKIKDKGSSATGWDRAKAMFVLFDFEVTGGSVAVSSLAAYNKDNLRFRFEELNLLKNGSPISNGDVISGGRLVEGDINIKYKGIAKNQSAWIDSEINVVINGDTINSETKEIIEEKVGEEIVEKEIIIKGAIPINLYEPLYAARVPDYTKNKWITNLNPTNDDSEGLYLALPSNLHKFEYKHSDGRTWKFDFEHAHAGCVTDSIKSPQIVNRVLCDCVKQLNIKVIRNIDGTVVNRTKLYPSSLSMGSWGVPYHYTITAKNDTEKDVILEYFARKGDNLILGTRNSKDDKYETSYYSALSNQEWQSLKSIEIPKGETVTFELVTMLACGKGGLNNQLRAKFKE